VLRFNLGADVSSASTPKEEKPAKKEEAPGKRCNEGDGKAGDQTDV